MTARLSQAVLHTVRNTTSNLVILVSVVRAKAWSILLRVLSRNQVSKETLGRRTNRVKPTTVGTVSMSTLVDTYKPLGNDSWVYTWATTAESMR